MWQRYKNIHWPLWAACTVMAVCVAGCASIGHPEGGPRDETPPVFVRSTPGPGAVNVTGTRIEAFFDENIQLDDAFNKVIVSPAQEMSPVVRSGGKRVVVELRDTLLPDATYTIDFGDAIKDLNEGNLLDGFALDFSTGPTIDTLRLSGTVLEARTLEPAQGMLVGVFAHDLSDTAVAVSRLERVARTNSYGQFTVRGLKDRPYRVYALNDVNRDNRWDRSEDVAFDTTLYRPRVEAIVVSDTLRTPDGRDSTVTRPGVAYYPADILLTWFNTGYKSQYVKDLTRRDKRRIDLVLATTAHRPSTIELIGHPGARLLEDVNATNDTLSWWLADRELVNTDSLTVALTHPMTDTLSRTVWVTDTLRAFYRPGKDELKSRKEALKPGADTVKHAPDFLNVAMVTPTTHDLYMPLVLGVSRPVGAIDTLGLRLSVLNDTVWQPVPLPPLVRDSLSLLRYSMDLNPMGGTQYRFEADSAAFTDIYGNPARALRHEFKVKTVEDYATIAFDLSPLPADSVSRIMVELLDSSDKPVRVVRAGPDGHAVFGYVNPGKYFARMYIDADADGVWTTGSLDPPRQPEEVNYYPRAIDARPNWDLNLQWNYYDTEVDRQKPREVKKNKPRLKKGEKEPDLDPDGELDEWGNPIDRRDRDRRDYGTPQGSLPGMGGFKTTGNSDRGVMRR